MSEIRTTKIDWVEFVPYKDYLRLKEEKEELEYLGDINEELKQENKKLKEKLEQIKETYIRFEDSEKEYNKWLWELDKLIMNR